MPENIRIVDSTDALAIVVTANGKWKYCGEQDICPLTHCLSTMDNLDGSYPDNYWTNTYRQISRVPPCIQRGTAKDRKKRQRAVNSKRQYRQDNHKNKYFNPQYKRMTRVQAYKMGNLFVQLNKEKMINVRITKLQIHQWAPQSTVFLFRNCLQICASIGHLNYN